MGMPKSNVANRRSAGRWIATAIGLAVTLIAWSRSGTASAQGTTLRALTTFGSNGWIAPGTVSYLPTTGDNQRGLAFNPVTGNLVLVSRAGGNQVRILSATTGTSISTLSTSGITGGAGAVVNMVGVAGDGAIYVGNLTTSVSDAFKVYRYADETTGVAPTVAFSGTMARLLGSGTTLQATRVGDSFAVTGSGNSTLIAASGNSNNSSAPAGATSMSYFSVLSVVGGTATATPFFAIPGTTTTNGNNDYRLSLSFVDSDTVIGKAASGNPPRRSDFNIATGTANASGINGTGGWSILSYREIDSKPYMAAVNINNNNVGIFDLSVAGTATLLNSFNTTTSNQSNGNSTGSIAWGNTTQPDPASPWYYETPVYVLSTNNGIQAMIFSVPEPSTWAMLAAGAVTCGGAAVSRSRSRRRRSA